MTILHSNIISILTYFIRRNTISEKRRTFFNTIVFKRKTSTETHSFWAILLFIPDEIEINLEKRKSYRNNFRSSQILLATWPDAKSSEIALSEACIELCWVNETVSHRALFSIDFNVYIFEHVDEHIAFVNRTSWLCYVIMLSKHIVLLLLEHDNRHIVFWSMNQISFDV